ncbi:MAG: lysophospholipid acyltransferase family protein [Gemmatimonadaceae bacterium]
MSADGPSVARRARVWIASVAGGLLYRLLATTWRFRVIGGEPFEACIREGKPAAFALWHGEMLPLIWWWRGRRIRALISTHSDGEIIARIVEGIGYRTTRGSSTREGTRALRELIGALRDSEQIAVTPDGPRGPRHAFAPGVVLATQRLHAPIILARARVRSAWVLHSWDRFVIPKPFARVELFHSPLIWPDREGAPDADAQAGKLADTLNDLTDDEYALT